MENEIWKDIPGFEGLYQASNLGRIKSLKNATIETKNETKGKILKPAKCGKYYQVCLRKDGKSIRKYIHRLIGKTFIENPNDYSDINHKDGNYINNNVNNLEWCTRSYNIKHAYRILKRKVNRSYLIDYVEKHKRKIDQYDLGGNFIKSWDSINAAEKALNITSIGKICECCQHKYGRKTAFGYKWEYHN